MTASARRRMTADEFLDWAMAQPDGARYELVAGEVVAMAPERASHARAKVAVFDALRAAVANARGLEAPRMALDGYVAPALEARVEEALGEWKLPNKQDWANNCACCPRFLVRQACSRVFHH